MANIQDRKQMLRRCSLAEVCVDTLCFMKNFHLCYPQAGFFCKVVGKRVHLCNSVRPKRARAKKKVKP